MSLIVPGHPESAGITGSRGFVAGWSRSGKRVEMGMGNGQRATAQLQMLLGCINLCVCPPSAGRINIPAAKGHMYAEWPERQRAACVLI